MGEVAATFISSFHNLPGATIKERHKMLFRLFNQHSSLTKHPQELDFITQNMKPTCHLEEIFFIDFLIYFRRFDKLYEKFLKGSPIAVKKITKHDWFYKKAFAEVGAEEFVLKVLPTLSHSLKANVLKKLPVDEKSADEVFSLLLQRYGVFLSTVLLPKCTSGTIEHVLTSYPVTLTQKQLIDIHSKDPKLIYVYLRERSKHANKEDYLDKDPFMVYIAQKDPEMFSNLYSKYKFKTEIGRRTTKSLIATQKGRIVKKLESYIDILNLGVFVRKLGTDLQSLLFKRTTSSSLYWQMILKYYPKSQQFKIYKTVYDSTFHYKFGENVDAISEEVLRIIPKLEREQIAKKKLEKDGDQKYLTYVNPRQVLQEFLEKVNYLNAAERGAFIQRIVESSLLSEDLDSLLKICELVSGRFKNDGRDTRELFFVALAATDKFTKCCKAEHWKLIMDIVAISNAKNDWISNERLLRLKHVEFLLYNQFDTKDVLTKYDGWCEVIMYENAWKSDSKICKLILTQLLEIGLVKPNLDKELDAEYYDCKLAYVCKYYNKHNPRNMIDIHKHARILKSVKSVLENRSDHYIDCTCIGGVEYMICQNNVSEEVTDLKKLYFKALEKYGQTSGIMWFLKNDPKTLEANYDEFLKALMPACYITTNSKQLWRHTKKYSHLGLDQRTIEFCKSTLAKDLQNKKLVDILAILSTPSSYLEFFESFKPTTAKVDLTDDDTNNLYQVQGRMIRWLTYLNSPETVLPTVLECCKGDYLQFALSPLYSSVCTTPENRTNFIIDYIKEQKAISVNKHALNLSCLIYDIDTVYQRLKDVPTSQLMSLLRYFSKNPSETLWKLVVEKIADVKKDVQVFKWAININVPFEYKSRFLEIIWQALDSSDNKEIKKILITSLSRNSIKNFDFHIANRIIHESFFDFEGAFDVFGKCLIYLKAEEKFHMFSSILTALKDKQPLARKKLNKAIVALYNNYMDAEYTCKQFVEKLLQVFNSIFSTSDAFEEFLLLNVMVFKGETVDSCCRVIVGLNSTCEEKYGNFAIHLFAGIIKEYVFKHIFKTDAEQVELCHSLLKMKESVNDSLLILALLPNRQPEEIKPFSQYGEMMQELQQAPEDVVQLQLNIYLKSRVNV